MATHCTALHVPHKGRLHALIFPREHGAWGLLLVPLASGAVVALLRHGGGWPLVPLTVGALALFWARTPFESLLGAGPMRARSSQERRAALHTVLALSTLGGPMLLALLWGGANQKLLWLGAIAGTAFILQALLKTFRPESRIAVQLIGAAGLAAAAPAAYYVSSGNLDATAAMLWLTNWMFAGNQIHFVQLRIHSAKTHRNERPRCGWRFLAGHVVAGSALAALCRFGLLPWLALLAFAPITIRGLAWFLQRPAPLVIRRLGWSELAHAVAFGVLLVAAFHFAR
jgi:YwiC-like protein